MNKKPLATVLLPVYNNEEIYKAIDSVLAQTFKDFELLIIDNASTDKTVEVIKKYQDKRIKLVVNKENIGPTGSLNKGINLIESKYIARIDADDLMLPTRLEKQVKFLQENPEYGIVGSWTKNIDENDNLGNTHKLCTTDKGIRLYTNIQSPFYHPAVMIRNSVLKDHNLNYNLNIRVAVEYELWHNILKYSKGCNLPEVLSYYRVGNGNSLTAKNADKRLQEYLNVREQICIENRQEGLLKCLKIERKNKKNIFDCIAIFIYMRCYLKKNIEKNEQDYYSLKSCVDSRIYKTICIENKTFLANCLRNVIKKMKNC